MIPPPQRRNLVTEFFIFTAATGIHLGKIRIKSTINRKYKGYKQLHEARYLQVLLNQSDRYRLNKWMNQFNKNYDLYLQGKKRRGKNIVDETGMVTGYI